MPLPQLPLFMASIRALESGGGNPEGDYAVRGPTVKSGMYAGERAMGAYQIMPGNWPSWSAAAGISGADWRDPAAQDRVARDQFTRLYRKYGRWDAVAVAWFAGQKRADRFVKGADLSGINDGNASVPEYVTTIRSYMQKFDNDPRYSSEQSVRDPAASGSPAAESPRSLDETFPGNHSVPPPTEAEDNQNELSGSDLLQQLLAGASNLIAGTEKRLDYRSITGLVGDFDASEQQEGDGEEEANDQPSTDASADNNQVTVT